MIDRYKSCAKTLLYLALFLIFIVYFINGTIEFFKEPIKAKTTQGFKVEQYTKEPFKDPTSIVFTGSGMLLVATRSGEIFSADDLIVDGKIDKVTRIAKTPSDLLGIAFYKDRLFVSYTGVISELRDDDNDGVFETEKKLAEDLPTGRHQNNGLAIGPGGRLYFTIGSTSDRGPEKNELSSTINSMNLDGSDRQIFARGFRNPYDLVFDAEGRLFATENGPDDPPAPDELNLVEEGRNYGYPKIYGTKVAAGFTPPFAVLGNHVSANGIAAAPNEYYGKDLSGGVAVAMFGNFFGGKEVGRKVVFIATSGKDKGKMKDMVTGLKRPLDLTFDKKGRLYIADFEEGHIYRVARNSGALGEDNPLNDAIKGTATSDARPGSDRKVSQGISLTGKIVLFVALSVLIIGIILMASYKGKKI